MLAIVVIGIGFKLLLDSPQETAGHGSPIGDAELQNRGGAEGNEVMLLHRSIAPRADPSRERPSPRHENSGDQVEFDESADDAGTADSKDTQLVKSGFARDANTGKPISDLLILSNGKSICHESCYPSVVQISLTEDGLIGGRAHAVTSEQVVQMRNSDPGRDVHSIAYEINGKRSRHVGIPSGAAAEFSMSRTGHGSLQCTRFSDEITRHSHETVWMVSGERRCWAPTGPSGEFEFRHAVSVLPGFAVLRWVDGSPRELVVSRVSREAGAGAIEIWVN